MCLRALTFASAAHAERPSCPGRTVGALTHSVHVYILKRATLGRGTGKWEVMLSILSIRPPRFFDRRPQILRSCPGEAHRSSDLFFASSSLGPLFQPLQ